jgi:hypothetical protein
MELKLFEIRDRSTLIAVYAFRPVARVSGTAEEMRPVPAENFLLGRCGWTDLGHAERNVYVGKLNDSECYCDPHKWSDRRTMLNAHRHIQEHFDILQSGTVIDVEFILGESSSPKQSEGQD